MNRPSHDGHYAERVGRAVTEILTRTGCSGCQLKLSRWGQCTQSLPPAGVEVLNGSQVNPALPTLQVGDVSNLFRVRLGRGEVPNQKVIGDPNAANPDRCLVALFLHQP